MVFICFATKLCYRTVVTVVVEPSTLLCLSDSWKRRLLLFQDSVSHANPVLESHDIVIVHLRSQLVRDELYWFSN